MTSGTERDALRAEMADLRAELRALADRDEIRALIARYGPAVGSTEARTLLAEGMPIVAKQQ
jgi:hypothetical protein